MFLTLIKAKAFILLTFFVVFISSRQSMYQLWKLRQDVFDAEVVR